MNLPYDASRQKEHCSPRPDFDAPERTPRNVLWIQQFRSWQSHDLPVMITSEDCGQIADAFEAADQRIAALEQGREWCPDNPFATHGNDEEWVCDCYACDERRDALCDAQHLRAEVKQLRDQRDAFDIECEKLGDEVERLRAKVFTLHQIAFTYHGGCKCDDCNAHRALHEGGNDG